MPPPVSVIIVTLNRASWLASLLSALRHQNYSPFEIIVVNGPSTDNTEEVLATYSHMIRVGSCRQNNISQSRNVGIEMAGGEYVVFLDDDAIPDENWIAQLVAGFDSPEVAGTTGTVIDGRFNTVQYECCAASRLGDAQFDLSAMPAYFPGSARFPYLVGCNCMFRRDALLQIGGFDPEYDYYLDETDVCVRLVDAGYKLRKLDNGVVYHLSAPGPLRNSSGIVTNWYPVLKNKLYFSLKHTPEGFSWQKIMRSFDTSVAEFRESLEQHCRQGRITGEEMEAFHSAVRTAHRNGIVAGLCPQPPPLSPGIHGTNGSSVFKTVSPMPHSEERLTICLLSQGDLKSSPGGIARRTFDLARGLAERGHTVHVLTRSLGETETVAYEDEVWVHRLLPRNNGSRPPAGLGGNDVLWQHSCRLRDEIRDIHRRKPVDIVEGSVWDSEGLATILDGEFCTLTNLETPLKVFLDTCPEYAASTAEERAHHDALVQREICVATQAAAVRAVSQAVVETMESRYGLALDRNRLFITPNGIRDRSRDGIAAPDKAGDRVDVFFVGRFEGRKGIDVLLQVIPRVLSRFSQVRFTLAGGDSHRPAAVESQFRSRYPGLVLGEKVVFTGRIDDSRLDACLARCDIFVAPSRYESFGLVYLEGMMFGKPVIGCRAGGIPEVVQHGVNGLLAHPGDAETLYEALVKLVANPTLRTDLGTAGRRRFLADFTDEKYVERTLASYRQAVRRWKGLSVPCGA